jgi:hypothetical protein
MSVKLFDHASDRERITLMGQCDPTVHPLFECFLAKEEENTEALVDLLEDMPKD